MVVPSTTIRRVLDATTYPGSGPELMRERRSDFPDELSMQLTGLALDPTARQQAEDTLDSQWGDAGTQERLLGGASTEREVIVGSGYHAAVYAATRVQMGYSRPIVLERSRRAGGIFAVTRQPTFYLNSRNRKGSVGLAGDRGANLNYIPGALIQPGAMSMSEYQTNTDMALAIRLTLAQYADVVTGAEVTSIAERSFSGGYTLKVKDRSDLVAGRVIIASGLGSARDSKLSDGKRVLTYPEFLQRMDGPWPLRGLKRVAVVGGGNAALTAIEGFLGLSPQPRMAATALDAVERVDVYAPNLPVNCENWLEQVRSRYRAIGPYLRPDRFGMQQVNVFNRRVVPVSLPDLALVEGRGYDLVVLATGFREPIRAVGGIRNAGIGDFGTYDGPDGRSIARRSYTFSNVFRVGPSANLDFDLIDREAGITTNPENKVSMFRLGAMTATLAATLPDLAKDAKNTDGVAVSQSAF